MCSKQSQQRRNASPQPQRNDDEARLDPAADVALHEHVDMKVRMVRLGDIEIIPEDNSFRDEDELTDAAIETLADDIAAHGLLTPLLVQEKKDGGLLGRDCHRRMLSLLYNIKKGREGFSLDMLVPAYVMPAETSELAATVRALASNNARQPLRESGIFKAAVKLKLSGFRLAERNASRVVLQLLLEPADRSVHYGFDELPQIVVVDDDLHSLYSRDGGRW